MIIQIHNLRKFTPAEQLLIRTACNKGQPVLDWEVWEQRIIKATYAENKGKSGLQIVKLIKSGTDGIDKAPDGDIDLDMEGFFSFSNTVGYTYLNTYKTWMNRRILREFDEAEIFGHIMHELMHRAYGFKHSFRPTRSKSVPYRVGYISRDCYREFYKGKTIEEQLAGTLHPMVKKNLEIKVISDDEIWKAPRASGLRDDY